MTQNPHSLQSVQVLLQELMNCGLLIVQLSRELEQRVLLHEEHSRKSLEDARGEATPGETHLVNEEKAANTQRLTPKKCGLPLEMVSAQCRACCQEVFRRPDSSGVFNADGSEHSATCKMRHIVCRDAQCVAIAATE